MAGILGFGAYIPRLRLQRSAVLAAHGWFNPSLKSLAKGERSFANWDEDVITMAVEAARDGLHGHARETIGSILLASTTAPFADRQNAGIVKEALNLPDTVATLDIGGSRRAGVSALIQALKATEAGQPTLCIASEKQTAQPGSEAEMTGGHAAAAFLVGAEDGLARLLATHSLSADFVDHFRADGQAFDVVWETRWIREEGYGKLVPGAINALLAKASLQVSDIDVFVFASPLRGVAISVAKAVGIAPAAVVDPLDANVGDTGAAHPLLLLAHALERAEPGQRILVAGFGSGCDALLLERTDVPLGLSPRLGVRGWLARRKSETNYVKYLSLNGLLSIERGMRAEIDHKQPLSALWRNRRTVLGLVGGRCCKTGTVQFPKSEIGVNPNDRSPGAQEDYPLAEKPARILTYTADSLTYTPDPPAFYGMVEFEGGGRMHAEFCDAEAADIEVGRPMRMVFRIKGVDEPRGFTKYFWKAAPAA